MNVYGIKNCNTVKKALDWLEENHRSFEFVDFKKAGLDEALFDRWVSLMGWEALINKKGTTWKKLSPEVTSSVIDARSAYRVLANNTSAIKRPVIDLGDRIILGFDAERYQQEL